MPKNAHTLHFFCVQNLKKRSTYRPSRFSGQKGKQAFNFFRPNAKSQYWKYVDDLTFAENRNIFKPSELQKDLNKFSDWAKDNQLKLNLFKCKALEICFKNGVPLHADIMIGTEKLPFVNKAKF